MSSQLISAIIPTWQEGEWIARAFARVLQRSGQTRYVREVAAVTSSRRYVDRPWSTLMQWTVLQALYSLGAPPEALARWYAPIRAAEGRSKPAPEPRPNQEAAG